MRKFYVDGAGSVGRAAFFRRSFLSFLWGEEQGAAWATPDFVDSSLGNPVPVQRCLSNPGHPIDSE